MSDKIFEHLPADAELESSHAYGDLPTEELLERRTRWLEQRDHLVIPTGHEAEKIAKIIGRQEFELTFVRLVDLETIDREASAAVQVSA